MRTILPYYAIFRQRMLAETQYRASFWAKVATNIFWGYVRAAILYAYYAYASGAEAALSMEQAVTFIWLGQIALNLAPGFGVDLGVWNKIRSGDVGVELIRPLDLYSHWYFSGMATKLSPFLLAIVPVTAVALLVPGGLGMSAPASAAGLACCALTLLTGLTVSCAGINLSYAMLLDTRVGEGPSNAALTVMQILAGGYLPLQLWPDALQKFLYYQPFASLMDIPLRFYVGSAPVSDLPRVLLVQAAWTAALVWLGRRWIGRNLKKLVIQGG